LISYGYILGVAFFALLCSAALTSAVSMLEVNVAAVMGQTGMSRRKASLLLTMALIALGLPSALSYSSIDLSFFGSRVLDLLDETVGTLGLPIAAFLVAMVFRWFMDEHLLHSQLGVLNGWMRSLPFLTKYAIPTVLIIITILSLMEQ